MTNIVITERQFNLIMKNNHSGDYGMIEESKWYNVVGDVLGIFDPTGIVDVVNAISYFNQGDHLFGMLTLISAIPYAGDIVAKPVLGALKIGGESTKGLKIAMEAAKVGKTAEASATLAKIAKEPGVVGKFLQSATSWAPKLASKVEKLPGGVFKGFKDTILDYLKLFENAGAKSLKFQKQAGSLAKTIGTTTKPVENIAALKSILKNEKVVSNLTKKGPLAQIFLGGVPRLFGNRQLRILMRRTKIWLGFLDFVGVANFVGPDEVISKMGDEEFRRKFDEYSKTTEAKQYAKDDFGTSTADETTSVQPQQTSPAPRSSSETNPLSSLFSTLLGGQTGNLLGAI